MKNLLKAQPESADSHILWGQVFAAQLQSREAEVEFRRAVELDSKVASAHFFLGVLHLKAGKLEEAEREFSAELAGHPGDASARYHLAFTQLAQQKTNQAIPLLREVVAEQPNYAEAHYSLGKALLQQEDVAGAMKIWRRQRDWMPENLTATTSWPAPTSAPAAMRKHKRNSRSLMNWNEPKNQLRQTREGLP